MKSIIGKRFDDPIAEEFRNRYVNKMILDNDRPVFLHNETDQLFIEELIAYQFQNAKQQASATAGEKVKDVVITVSTFMDKVFVSGSKADTRFYSRLHHLQINMNVKRSLTLLNLLDWMSCLSCMTKLPVK